jgi:hypothetical protein
MTSHIWGKEVGILAYIVRENKYTLTFFFGFFYLLIYACANFPEKDNNGPGLGATESITEAVPSLGDKDR